MAKKERKRKKMAAQQSEELWLVSYADMMTLVACFFIIMVAFANYDPAGFNKKVKNFTKNFRTQKNKASRTKFDIIQEEIVKHPNIKKMSKVTLEDDELLIRFNGTVLFDQGNWDIRGDMVYIIDSLIDIIKTVDSDFRILILGHTSELDISRKGLYASDWQLSSARAASVADRFEFFGFSPENIVPIGKGATRPLGPERDEKGRVIKANVILNNRVEIRVLTPIDKKAKRFKVGDGVLFK